MIKKDEDALICDLAETYQIYDYRQFPANLVAVFSVGLRENSRIRMSLSDEKLTIEQTMLAGILDRLSILLWSKTKDGQKGINQPKSIIDSVNEKPKEKITSFNSGEDFMELRKRFVKERRNKWQQN